MKVFLSHSVKGDPANEAIARKLFRTLEASNFEPFLDFERLDIGEDWETILKNEIDKSDAAILLLSKKAIEHSEWVAREIHLLQVREGTRPGFLILPLLLGDVQTRDLSEGQLGHLDLLKRQVLRVADDLDWTSRVLKQLERARSGVLETYLDALQSHCERLSYASLRARYSMPQLSEIYICQFVEEQRAGGGVEADSYLILAAGTITNFSFGNASNVALSMLR